MTWVFHNDKAVNLDKIYGFVKDTWNGLDGKTILAIRFRPGDTQDTYFIFDTEAARDEYFQFLKTLLADGGGE